MKRIRSYVSALMGIVLLLGVTSQQASAAESNMWKDQNGNWLTTCYDENQNSRECSVYWFKGSAYASTLQNGWSDIVVSTSAWFNKTSGRGWERIRVWDRRSQVQTYYDSVEPGWLVLGPSQVNVRFYKSNAETIFDRYKTFVIDDQKVYPQASAAPISIPPLVHALAGWVHPVGGVITELLDVLSASTLRGPVTHISETGNPWDKTIKITGDYGSVLDSSMELPATYKWDEADQSLSTKNSGVLGEFGYELDVPSFELWPQAMLWYRMAAHDGVEFTYWDVPSGVANVKHLVN